MTTNTTSNRPLTDDEREADRNAERAACEAFERAARAEARLVELEQRRTSVDDWRRRCWAAEDERNDLAKRLARALLERDSWKRLASDDMGREARFKRERDEARRAAERSHGSEEATMGEDDDSVVLCVDKAHTDEAYARRRIEFYRTHADFMERRAVDSEARAEKAERERDEARRAAERLRALLRRQAAIAGAMDGLRPGAETPGCEPFPWEREGGDDGGR